MKRICRECQCQFDGEQERHCIVCQWFIDNDVRQRRIFLRFSFGVAIFVVSMLTVFFLSGCAAMDGYDRSHSFSYQDAEGRSLNYAIQLRPTRGYAK